jgi:hypothetical protein
MKSLKIKRSERAHQLLMECRMRNSTQAFSKKFKKGLSGKEWKDAG